MIESVYVHIPFCRSKCYYCSFISYDKLNLISDYLYALEKEIIVNYEGELLKTLYFGGGTPSILNAENFNHIIKLFNFSSDTEITSELNPENLNADYLKSLKDIGINRISLGCQTFDDNILKMINRRHDSKQVMKAVEDAKKVGFDNISLDFIYGLPNQTCEMFISDLKKGVELGVEHISLYGLTIEDGCYFSAHLPKYLPSDDSQADMYTEAVKFLTSCGFEHYEISNFSKKGYFSRHNMNYWNNSEYYGFGVAAHGYKNGIRYGNVEVIEDYIKNPYIHKEERIETDKDRLEEEIFLGLRRISGIDVISINQKYNIDFEKKYSNIIEKYTNLKLLQKTPQGFSLTLEGILVSNTVLADFIL